MIALQLASMAWLRPGAVDASPDGGIVAGSLLLVAGILALVFWSILLSSEIRRGGVALTYLCLLAAIWCFRPWASAEYNPGIPFDRGTHIEIVAAAAMVGTGMLALSLVSRRTGRRHGAVLGVLVAAQLLLTFLALRAESCWPGGDDGRRFDWVPFVVFPGAITLLAGGVGWSVYLVKAVNAWREQREHSSST